MRRQASARFSTLADDAPTGADELARQLQSLLAEAWATEVRVDGLARFHGGAARETWRFTAHSRSASEGLVVRRDPPASLIETSRAAEFHVLKRAHGGGLPAPEPLMLDADGRHLGRPGFVMREIAGGHAANPFEPDAYGAAGVGTGRALFTALGRLHALVPGPHDFDALPHMDAATRVAHWQAEIARHRIRPEPIAEAAGRWLARHVPAPSGPPAIVHGDFRSGNFLVDADNRLLAVLDWEMAHIGDPAEDLAWAMDPLWGHGMPGRVAGTCTRADAFAAWEAASGRRLDQADQAWWALFAAFQGLAIWISSAGQVAHGRTSDPAMIFAALLPYRAHQADAARLLKALAA
jgi:aminoglycoside phosphotransferase (APT) family kinase protein